MIFGSVCSGIEAASVAWEPLGWKAAWFSEIEKFPSAVLAHRWPGVENRGDMTKFKEWPDGPIDVLVGGTLCQSFSIAGLRKGLDDPRGNLMLTYLAIAHKYRPQWLVWENVPGVLSSGGGRDFGIFLGGLAQLGYGFAYRVLDAQYFGVPQRRRRVFVVGHLGDWRPAAAVLFDAQSLSGNPAPSRKAGERIAPSLAQCAKSRGGLGTSNQEIFSQNGDSLVRPGDFGNEDGTGRGTPLVYDMRGNGDGNTVNSMVGDHAGRPTDYTPVLLTMREGCDGGGKGPLMQVDRSAALATGNGQVLFQPEVLPINTQIATRHKALGRGTGFGVGADGDPAFTLQGAHSHAVQYATAVRRLTPRECERLQGFPDDYTLIPWRKGMAPDGPRYKALGNSMAVPVMRWIGERIQLVSEIVEAAHV